jgi:hypothetical protein
MDFTAFIAIPVLLVTVAIFVVIWRSARGLRPRHSRGTPARKGIGVETDLGDVMGDGD